MAGIATQSAGSSPPVAGNRPVWFVRWPFLLAAAGVLAGLGIIYSFSPEAYWIYPPCLLYRGTGFYCPGCGTTRALHALLHGDWKQAAQHNLLFVALLPALATFFAVQGIAVWKQGNLMKLRYGKHLPFALLVALILFGVARNLPFPWAAWLAP